MRLARLGLAADLGAQRSQRRWISRTGHVDGVRTRSPDSAAIRDDQELFMAAD
jgi:hypothetical protein